MKEGRNTVFSKTGHDKLTIQGGDNTVFTDSGNDRLIISGGLNVLNTSSGGDNVNRWNKLLTSFSGGDTINISGGVNDVSTGSGNDSVTLSDGSSNIDLGDGDDILSVTSSVDLSTHVFDGGDGDDQLNIIHTGSISLPGPESISSIETIFVSNSQHQSIDFSRFSGIPSITMDSGITIDGSTIITTIGSGQFLILDSISDGDTAAASLADGGIQIAQDASLSSLDLRLDDVGPSSSIVNENVFIDIAGTGVSTASITSSNTNFITLSNTGGSLTTLNLSGTGTLGIISNAAGLINAASLSASLILTGSSSGNTITGTTGNDTITLSGGTNNVTSGTGDDTVALSSGADTVDTGDGNDIVSASAGTNFITTGNGDDQITVSGGTNEINAGEGNDTVTASGGASNVDIRVLEGGNGTDILRIISTGNVTLPTASGFESIFVSDTVHQSLNFSVSASVTSIELDSGSTIDGDTITTTLGVGQSLTLDSIVDGDTAAASLADGGIVIAQEASITLLDLTLDDVGPNTSTTNENVFIDIAGTGVTTAKITSGNDSFVVISNSGGALTGLELLGTGTMALGTLPTSITNVNGAAASANLKLTIGNGSNTIRGGTGNDAITLSGGINDVETGDGDDTITTATNLVPGDTIDGGNGTDTFEVIHTGLASLPSLSNLTSIERIAIQDTVHQTLDSFWANHHNWRRAKFWYDCR